MDPHGGKRAMREPGWTAAMPVCCSKDKDMIRGCIGLGAGGGRHFLCSSWPGLARHDDKDTTQAFRLTRARTAASMVPRSLGITVNLSSRSNRSAMRGGRAGR